MQDELFAISFAEPVGWHKRNSDLIADWDVPKWAELNRLAQAVVALLSDLLALPRNAIKTSKILRLEGAQCVTRVAAHIVDPALADTKGTAVDLALSEFSALIGGEKPLDDLYLFSVSDASFDQKKTIASHARQLLEAHGGKRLTSPIILSGKNWERTLKGRFAAKPIYGQSNEALSSIEGSVVLIDVQNRTVGIAVSSNTAKQIIRFDEARFLEKLRSKLGLGGNHHFDIREIRKGKKVYLELVEMKEGVEA